MNPRSLAYSDSSRSTIVQALCSDLLDRDVNLNISEADEMLRFFLFSQANTFDQAVALYLDSGRRIWSTLRQIISWRFGSLDWGGRILDFASGYGRVTRHIVNDVPKERVWISDIYAEGVAFQQRELGVQGILSTTDPADFQCDLTFDCILVSSLFTHLPRSSFEAWLGRLGSLLTPKGLLLFSVHDISLRPPGGAQASPEGIAFQEQSESSSLQTKDYGTSWVTEEFVRRAAQSAVGPYPVLRFPRGLANYQDLFVLVKGDLDSPPSDLRIEREADGFLEHCSRVGKRQLHLSGWLADRVAGKPPQEVRIWIDDVLVASCRDLQPRPSASEAFASDPTDVVGWQITVEIPAASEPESAHLRIRALSIAGEELALCSGSVVRACLRTAQLDAVMLQGELTRREAAYREELARQSRMYESRLDELTRRLHAVYASRFWKARNLWFGFKRAVGLTDET